MMKMIVQYVWIQSPFPTRHDPEVSNHNDVINKVIKEVIPASYFLDEQTKFHQSNCRFFVIGGPQGDSGLTGRKIIVDTYAATSRHGGGAFSGKGCDEGGPFSLLCSSLHCQEYR